MEFIGDSLIISKDIYANPIYVKLKDILKDEEALLYYQFPFYLGDITSDNSIAKLLLISKRYGLFYFDYPVAGEELEETKQRADRLYSYIESRFAKITGLKKTERA